MSEVDIKRGIKEDFIAELKNSGLIELYEKNKEHLFLAIRNKYINLYYNCASVCKIEYHPRSKEKLSCYVHKKYLGIKVDKENLERINKKYYEKVSAQFIIDNYKKIIKNIKEAYSCSKHKEKFAQQKLIKNNNSNPNSEWYCIDIEYIKQRNTEEETKYGRWDIIAISKKCENGKHRVALIELKCTRGAIGGDSGIVKHASDYINFMESGKNKFKTYKEHLKSEIKNIVNSLYGLEICNIKIDDVNQIADEPEFYFITLNNKNNELLRTMRRYIFKDEPGHAKETVQEKEQIDITKENEKKFIPKFLFSSQEYDKVKINDILDESQYDNIGLESTAIIIHRGTHQIGGCITEIRSKKGTRIAIDIGQNLPSLDDEEIQEISVDGLIKEKKGVKKFDAVFITHYHGDHIGLYDKVLSGIDIYTGEYSKQIYKILQKRLVDCKKIPEKNLHLIENFKVYRENEPIIINEDIKVTPISSDHSAFDTHMLLIECDGKKILHTGDFRLHGIRGKELLKNLEKLAGKIDYLICEGTTLSRPTKNSITEEKIGNKAEKIFKKNKFSFVLCSSTNIDRIAEIYHAALAQERIFLCDKYQKQLLEYISSIAKNEKLDDKYIFESSRIKDYNHYILPYVVEHGFVMMVRANPDFKDKMNHYTGSKFIYSQWDGYLKEKFKNQYRYLQEDFVPQKKELLHTSGHADYEAIKKVAKLVRPKEIIPIHGENPRVFYSMRLNQCKVRLLNDGEIFYI